MNPQACYCLNPHCHQSNHPQNLHSNFCQSCGSNLIINNKYRVKKLLSNNSGFGLIYEAETEQERKILKVLKPEHNDTTKAIELFQQEYQVLWNLTQQGIKGIPQVEKDNYFLYQTKTGITLYCLIMEKVEGIDLSQWLKNNGQLSQKQAIKWLKEITTILAKIHQQNYFHRDLKPANIMQRLNGELVLIDFGTAREETQTYYQKLQGQYVTGIESAGYTPEEQKNGKAVMQSDFFALGRTFVHLLTGQFPLNMYDAYDNILKWREHTENINPFLLDLIDELMAISAKDRPAHTHLILQKIQELETNIISAKTTTSPLSQQTTLPLQSNWLNQVIPIAKLYQSIFLSFALLTVISYGIYKYIEANTQPQTDLKSTEIETINQLPEELAQDNQAQAKFYVDQGLKLYQQQKYSEALGSFSNALVFNGAYPEAFYNRGLTYHQLQQYNFAIADFDRAIQFNPNYANAYNRRALTLNELKEYNKAITDFSQALQINPKLAIVYYHRGLTYQVLGDQEKALADLHQSATLYQQQGNLEWYNKTKTKIKELEG